MRHADPTTPSRRLVSCTGIATVDTIFGVDELPGGDGKFSAKWLQETGGGVAANAAVAVARLGGRSRFIGCVGTDSRSIAARKGLITEGVAVDGMHQIEHRPTPTSAVVVDRRGARMIINHVTEDFFDLADPRWAQDLAGADAVLVDLRWMAGATASVVAAEEAGIPSIVDVDRPVALNAEVLRHATHLLFSTDALVVMTGNPRPGSALLSVRKLVPGWIGVTIGRHGVLWIDGHTLRHRAGHEIETVDTLGAGDTFHGAFALALAEGRSESDAIRFANAAAALKCTRRGGRDGIPARHEVEHFIASRARSAS